jgi:riboflavin kinase / FMN adenylyltransferase
MQVIEGLENLRVPEQPRGVCVGAFDGFHVGHQYLLSQLCALSAERGYESGVVTFEPIPSEYFLPPGSPPRRLITREERIALAASLCCDMMAILNFNDELMRWDAHTFVQEVLVNRLNARLLIASGAHTMGFDRAGLDRITMVCREFDIEVVNSPILQLGELKVSSSEIRQLLWQGRVEEATGLLGRHYSLEGTVVGGRGVGRQLGFPTANLSLPEEKLIPADGVYAGLAYDETTANGERQPCPAAISIGTAPTFELHERLIEAHLLGEVSSSLMGHTLRLQFLRRLRSQQRFDDTTALTRQIALDVEQTSALAASVAQSQSITLPPTCILPKASEAG